MTLSINVDAHEDRGSLRGQVVEALAAIGFIPSSDAPLAGPMLTGNTESASEVAAATGKRPSGRTRQAAADKAAAATGTTGQAISTGEERVDPATEAQDKADEAAETKVEPVKLNHDSVRKMLGGYVMAYGMEAAQADGVGLIGTAKISDLKDDQAVLAKAVIAIAQGIEKNPNKREIAGDGITAEKLAELKPIVAAALAVK
ncbi:MAG: hypothetical protein ACXWLZ_00090 [Rhizomicrobium sp.]